MEAVQNVISDDSQMSQTICPSDQVLLTVYTMLIGMTKMETNRSVTAREPIRKLAGVWSFLVRKMVAMTKAFERTVAKVTMANRADRETWKPRSVAPLQGGAVVVLGISVKFLMK